MLVNLLNNPSKNYVGVRGTGFYVPERIVTNKEIEDIVGTSDEWIYQKIGIKERRIAAEHEATSDLAYKAAVKALENANLSPQDLDLIVLNCICPDHRDPATSCLVQAKLGAFNAAAFDVNAGSCPGTVYVLNIASNFISTGACENVLVIGADVFSGLIDWKDKITSVFFGDGAGAVVLSRVAKPGLMGYSLYADGKGYDNIIIQRGGSRARSEPISINPGLRDESAYLDMNGKAVWDFATEAFPASIKAVAEKVGIHVSDINVVIPHQANTNIVKESMKKLGLPFDRAYLNIERYGNTASASVFLALAESVEKGMIKSGDFVALAAFGGGLAWASALIQWNDITDFV